MNNLVSVIIPVYNAEKVVARCVESLIGGTYPNIEIILIDDYSKDNSFLICQQLAEVYSNIRVIHNVCNRGVSYSRNVGLQYATGKYLCFVDSDDWVEKAYIRTLYESVEALNVNFGICGFINHDEVHNHSTTFFKCTESESCEAIQLENSMIELFHGRLLQQLWNKIFRSDVIKSKEVTFDETLSMGEDFRFVLDYLSALEDIRTVLLPDCLYHYIRDSDHSLMSTLGADTIVESIKNIDHMIDILKVDMQSKQELLLQERKSKAMEYAYIVSHNKQLSKKAKLEQIRMIEDVSNCKLLRSSVMLLIKEKIAQSLRR